MTRVWACLALAGCAADLWDARQVQCSGLDSIAYSTEDDWPMRVASTVDADEDCEVKTLGIRDGRIEVDDGALSLEDVHEVDFEIEPFTFPSAGAYPTLDLQWRTATGVSRITDLDFHYLDFAYGPAVGRLHIEGYGNGAIGYGRPAAGLDDGLPSGAADGSDLHVWCHDCFVNARVDASIEVSTVGLTDDRMCERNVAGADYGLCTGVDISGVAGFELNVPSHEICIGPNTRHVRFTGGAASDHLKLVILGDAAASQLELVEIDTGGAVAIFTPDLGFAGNPAGVLISQVDIAPLNPGPRLLHSASQLVILRNDTAEEREERCQSKLPKVSDED
ncbi:MAG: hypothetical protein R3F61_07500 [Myxococcota bacterium]